MTEGPVIDCSGRSCGFAEFSGELGCTDGASCFEATMLVARESKFHDAALAKATQQIKEALEAIPPDPNGRQLSFLQTKMGTMLAWVRHDIEVPKGAVTEDSSEEDLVASLGLQTEPKAY